MDGVNWQRRAASTRHSPMERVSNFSGLCNFRMPLRMGYDDHGHIAFVVYGLRVWVQRPDHLLHHDDVWSLDKGNTQD
jgi:hypothetical protein